MNDTFENKQTSMKLSKIIFFICAIVYACAYVARGNYSVVVDLMKTNGIVDNNIAGLISAVYFICYTIGQVINGVLGDKKNPFWLIVIGVGLIIISEALMGIVFKPSFLLVIWWAINGLGQSMLWSPIYFILNNAVHKDFRFKALTLFALTTPIGKIASYFLSSLSLDVTLNEWKSVFFMASILMLLVLTLWLTSNLCLKNKIIFEKHEPVQEIKEESSVDKEKKNGLMKLLFSSGLIILVPAMFVHGLFLNGATEWVPSIIKNQYELSDSLAGYLTILIPVIGVSGSFISVLLYKKMFKKHESYTTIFIMSVSLALVGILFGIYKMNLQVYGRISECVLFIVTYGFIYTLQLGYNHITISVMPMHFNKYKCASSVSGILNAINYGGSAISTYVISFFVKDISIVFIIWGISLLIAIISTILFTPKWNKFSQETPID